MNKQQIKRIVVKKLAARMKQAAVKGDYRWEVQTDPKVAFAQVDSETLYFLQGKRMVGKDSLNLKMGEVFPLSVKGYLINIDVNALIMQGWEEPMAAAKAMCEKADSMGIELLLVYE